MERKHPSSAGRAPRMTAAAGDDSREFSRCRLQRRLQWLAQKRPEAASLRTCLAVRYALVGGCRGDDDGGVGLSCSSLNDEVFERRRCGEYAGGLKGWLGIAWWHYVHGRVGMS